MRSSAVITESRLLGSISTSSIPNLLPKKQKRISTTIQRSDGENIPPNDLNRQEEYNKAFNPTPAKSSPPQFSKSYEEYRNQQEAPLPADPHIKVVVRIRPVNDHSEERCFRVKKAADDSLQIGDRRFPFDLLLDSNSTQEDVFHSVGVPLVRNALAGFNTSILSYGQSGSGKTYTMWGPPSAMVGGCSMSNQQGIAPRIFNKLFEELHREQESSEGRQVNFQCRCSFLEIYNEQINDLLDPTHRNLQIKDDAKSGFYVERLTEEYVTDHESIIHLIIKGLSNRKIGATGINIKSSRSHVIFSCTIESWRKENSSTCFSSSRTSRISLVDLAGQDSFKHEDLNKKEAKNIHKSMSQLGLFITKPPHRTCNHSPLTDLLCESLGGNAKLTVICNISLEKRRETWSTLRFGQRVKLMRNEPVVNEITEDHVNDLTVQIRQLKEELIRAKTNAVDNDGLKGRSIRESAKQLRMSLTMTLPDSEKEDEVDLEGPMLSESPRFSKRGTSKKISPATESLAASIQKGLEIISYQEQQFMSNEPSARSFSFGHMMLKPCPAVDNGESKEEVLRKVCIQQEEKIQELIRLVEQYRSERRTSLHTEIIPVEEVKYEYHEENRDNQLWISDSGESESQRLLKEREVEKEELLREIQALKGKLQSYADSRMRKSSELLRSSFSCQKNKDLDKERERWTEIESEWISLTDELRIDLESQRRRAERVDAELRLEKKCTEELDDVLRRSVQGHARMVEHYAELQEKHNDLLGKHRVVMERLAEIKAAAAKAGSKGCGSRFTKALATELSVLSVEKEKEREQLKRENRSLRIQLKDTAEAVHAAGELLGRLTEAEEAISITEENFRKSEQENEKLKKQIEKLKRKHKIELITMKQYLAESRLPESALRSLNQEDDSDLVGQETVPALYDDQSWRAAFGAAYQER